MDITIKKIWVKNFKSLHDIEIKFNDINILIGPNGAGKTNIVECIVLIKEVLNYIKGKNVNPFNYWWGYDNVVWNNEDDGLEKHLDNNRDW